MAIATARLCLMGASSFVHVRFARITPSVSPRQAENTVYESAVTKMSGSAGVSGNTSTMHASGTSAGIAVSASCTLSFARSTCQGVTGSDCASQRFFPSSETEGVAMSFIAAMVHTPVHSSTSTQPPRLPKAICKSGRSSPPLITSATPATGSSRIPSPQLSI